MSLKKAVFITWEWDTIQSARVDVGLMFCLESLETSVLFVL